MSNNYETVASLNDLEALDDNELAHNSAVLVENFSWFLLDRTSTAEPDGKSVVLSSSGNGRWCIMTPQTMCIVAAVMHG